MKLCPKCSRSPLPFVMVLLISTVLAFITWLVLGLSQVEPTARLAAAAAVFLAVGGTLLHYVISCLKRHCRHDQKHQRVHGHTFSRPA
ncbi:hypothetical protein [Thiocapsa marina]|uniref:Uncharacterized protein n=1 Tax=Thiocapsa marina 5811 TaxID=768671 RepID=F9U5C6_9GAMM|nr:hypothetical protein [Thiocapsa marina]EGV20349.1 hypothetical protein ThimaDRAFT_0127 [Thiocapsa marina 5811]